MTNTARENASGGQERPDRDLFEQLDAATRITHAKRITARLVNHIHYLLDVHENNRVVLFSDTLSKQIPLSRAANAFNTFREALHQIEVVRLCALWDPADQDLSSESVPTVCDLIANDQVLQTLGGEEHARHIQPIVLDEGEYKTEHEKAVVRRAIEENQQMRGDERAAQALDELKSTIKSARKIRTSERLRSLRNLRNKHVAHDLTETREEKKSGPIDVPRYGDERELLEATLPIVETLYLWINGIGISLADSRAIDQKCAKALWESCTFKIERGQ